MESRSDALIHDKGLTRDDALVITARVVRDSLQAQVTQAWPDHAGFQADYRRVVDAVKLTGLDGAHANLIIMAWALNLIRAGGDSIVGPN